MSSRWIPRSRGNVDATTWGWPKVKDQKRAATHDAYKVTNQQRMAARRALEWIRASKAQLVFRDEISDLFNHFFYCACANAFPAPSVLQATSWVKTASFSCWLLNPGLRPKAQHLHLWFISKVVSNWFMCSFLCMAVCFVTKCAYDCSATWIFVVMFTKCKSDT